MRIFCFLGGKSPAMEFYGDENTLEQYFPVHIYFFLGKKKSQVILSPYYRPLSEKFCRPVPIFFLGTSFFSFLGEKSPAMNVYG